MEYLLLITAEESSPAAGPGDPGFEEMMAGWGEYTQLLMEGGHWLNGASLMPSATATTVRLPVDGSAPTIVDGPFLETKEQLAGYYTITARDLDEALELAGKMPIPGGVIEVRPVATRPGGAATQPDARS